MLVSFPILFADPAEAFRLNAQVGGEMFYGNALHQLRVPFDQLCIPFFCSFREQFHFPVQPPYILHLGYQPADPLTGFALRIKSQQMLPRDQDSFHIFYHFQRNRRGAAGEKRIVSREQVPLKMKINREFLTVFCKIITRGALQQKKDEVLRLALPAKEFAFGVMPEKKLFAEGRPFPVRYFRKMSNSLSQLQEWVHLLFDLAQKYRESLPQYLEISTLRLTFNM